MHTFHESNFINKNYHVIEAVRQKKFTKKQFSLYKLSNTTNGMDAVDNFLHRSPIRRLIQTTQRRTTDILSIFQKGSVFGLDDYQF